MRIKTPQDIINNHAEIQKIIKHNAENSKYRKQLKKAKKGDMWSGDPDGDGYEQTYILLNQIGWYSNPLYGSFPHFEAIDIATGRGTKLILTTSAFTIWKKVG